MGQHLVTHDPLPIDPFPALIDKESSLNHVVRYVCAMLSVMAF